MPSEPAFATSISPGGRNQETVEGAGEENDAIQEILKDLPQPASNNLQSDRLRYVPEGSKELGWQNTRKLVERHDRDLCQAYREQIDTLLVFAGLFSAVVTAFAIESYQWLQDDPADISVELLRDVVAILAQNMNATAFPPRPTTPNLSDAAVARINVFWFLSLTLSLSAALIAILCKQWLREFERDVGQSPETALAVRYIRFRGLEYWGVGSIVGSVPLMLQVGLALFLSGAVDLLWQLHAAVAGCVTAVAGATLVFYLATTLLPLAQYVYICFKCCLRATCNGDYVAWQAFAEPQCAFKSAQAWIFLRVAQPAIDYALKAYATCFTLDAPPDFYPLVLRPADSWNTFDLNWMKRYEHVHVGPKCAFEALAWVSKNLEETYLHSWIWHCVWAHWNRKRDARESMARTATDITCVARTYPDLFQLGRQQLATVRAQAMLFRCSLRADLPADTAVELILRIAPHVGVISRWTCEALEAVLDVNHGLIFHLSDDIAAGLVRLADLQTRAIIQMQQATASAVPMHGPRAVRSIIQLLQLGSQSPSGRLVPAVAVLALQWIRERSIDELRFPTTETVRFVVSRYNSPGHGSVQELGGRGVFLCARLVGTFSTLWPHAAESLRREYPQAMQELLPVATTDSSGNMTGTSEPSTCSRRQGPSGEVVEQGSKVQSEVRLTVVVDAEQEGGDLNTPTGARPAGLLR